MDSETSIIIFSVFGAAIAVLLVVSVVLVTMVASLRRRVNAMQATGRIRVQKLRMDHDRNHAFHNPGLAPEEELSKRGFSMYPDDVESGRNPERQTGGLAEDLAREIENRQHRQSANPLHQDVESRQQRQIATPPFLLQSIEEHKRTRHHGNPIANGRQSETNPNFIY